MKAKKNVVMVVVFRSSVIHIYIYHVYCCAAARWDQKNKTNYVVGWVAYETSVGLPKMD